MARWLPLPSSCCPVGWQQDTWPQPADHRTLWGQSAPQSVYCSPSSHTVCSEQGESECITCSKVRHGISLGSNKIFNSFWSPGSNLMMPSSAALQKVLGHMGAVAMRLTLLVWSENICMVSFTVRSCTWTFVSAAPVTKILSPEWGRNCVDGQKHQNEMSTDTIFTVTTLSITMIHLLLVITDSGITKVLKARPMHWYSHFYAMNHSLTNGF